MNQTKKDRTAISPTREENFPEWYQQVIKAAEMAEGSPVRGCMVIKPWGFGLWESFQRQFDDRIKARGVENAYFPLFIPLSFLQKEADHVEGFAKECAVVTHHRLEEKEGRLAPAGELEEPLIVRPTSETIIGEAFSRWVQSYRDLPLKINQWANVVRWEMRTRLFLRTAEFLWQEGHTVHASAEEAHEESLTALEVYTRIVEDVMAMPVIKGRKSPGERFPGADETYTIEMMMQDCKALQGGTSHFLGQNFSKAQEIQYSTPEGGLEYAYTTSWGITTRLLGAMVMIHGDDDGMRLPPRIAPKQAVILPVIPKEEQREEILGFCRKIQETFEGKSYHAMPFRFELDDRDLRGGEKNWQWIKRGIPLRIEVGPRDVASGSVMVCRRDKGHREKESIPFEELSVRLPQILDEIQDHYFRQAQEFRDAHIRRDIQTPEEMRQFFSSEKTEGFVLGKWCGDAETEEQLKESKITIRCLPLEQTETKGTCLITGREATLDAIFAKGY